MNERVDALRDKLLGGEARAAADIDPETEEIVLDNGKNILKTAIIRILAGLMILITTITATKTLKTESPKLILKICMMTILLCMHRIMI